MVFVLRVSFFVLSCLQISASPPSLDEIGDKALNGVAGASRSNNAIKDMLKVDSKIKQSNAIKGQYTSMQKVGFEVLKLRELLLKDTSTSLHV